MVLMSERLPSVDHKLASGSLRASILRTLSEYFIVPRLFVIGFRYGQPVLIRYAIDYVQSPKTNEDKGYVLVFVAAIVYNGLALSTRAYQQGSNRLQVMIRGALLGLVHEHSLLARYEPYSKGKIVAFATQVFKMIVQASLLLAAQPIMAVTLPICTVIVYVIQKVYLRTSRQLRLLELESRAAVNSSLLETVQGIETIRAFGWRTEVTVENIHVVDISQRPFYLLLCLNRWLNVVLNLLVASVAVGTKRCSESGFDHHRVGFLFCTFLLLPSHNRWGKKAGAIRAVMANGQNWSLSLHLLPVLLLVTAFSSIPPTFLFSVSVSFPS
ncbi:hypothetical protein N0V85_006576 [Neurospora sp. IMI 360204]|nr:hypothetical protein N0V85_006576 [Neurospora sp. IMI 360204]